MLSRPTLIGHARAGNIIVTCGVVIGIVLASGVAWIIGDLRAVHLEHAKQALSTFALVLADETDRVLQQIDRLQLDLISHVRENGIDSLEAFAQQMAS
jgi:hypothetical protein